MTWQPPIRHCTKLTTEPRLHAYVYPLSVPPNERWIQTLHSPSCYAFADVQKTHLALRRLWQQDFWETSCTTNSHTQLKLSKDCQPQRTRPLGRLLFPCPLPLTLRVTKQAVCIIHSSHSVIPYYTAHLYCWRWEGRGCKPPFMLRVARGS